MRLIWIMQTFVKKYLVLYTFLLAVHYWDTVCLMINEEGR